MYNDDFRDHSNSFNHYGTPHQGFTPHSGRYAYGSGDNPYQRDGSFLRDYQEAHAKGLSDRQFYEARGMTSTEFRSKLSVDRAGDRAWRISRARTLRAKGMSLEAIAKEIGVAGESTVRGLLKEGSKESAKRNFNIAAQLEKEVLEKGVIDVGKGVELEIGCSKEKLKAALKILQEKGYVVDNIRVEQLTNLGSKTTVQYLAKPGIEKRDIGKEPTMIKSINVYTPDGGDTFWTPERPANLDSKRVYVRYAEDGGTDRDGTIELRRGVEDLSLGGRGYAQVRIAVDGTHYMKGMAHYSSDIPDGYDAVYNSNKPRGSSKDKVFKQLKEDPDNPFGALIKARGQYHYEGKDGKLHLSPINIIKEEGDWDDYSKTLSSQFLAKQNTDLIKRQLKLTYDDNMAEYQSIKSLTNPAIKQKLLDTFAEQCDAAATDLKVISLPRQSTKVLLPVNTLKEDECYCPSLMDGERVALIRYPHGGIFEIPVLTVNNRNKRGQDIIGKTSSDAIGIRPEAAHQLSGADFDGDTAMVIPLSSRVKIDTKKGLDALKGFEPKDIYGAGVTTKTTYEVDKKTGKKKEVTHYYQYDKEFTPIDGNTQLEMGKISNLITDMTLLGAPEDKIARAVKHSMVVIDAEKHHLNYKQSEIDNNIRALKTEYQGGPNKGAATLISRAGAEVWTNERELASWKPDPKTGKWIYKETGRTYKDPKTGKEKVAQEKVARMELTDDARTLLSGTGNYKEALYADYANQMKALANQVRKESLSIKTVPTEPTAKKVYANEIESLTAKLKVAKMNAPKERQAQLIANQVARAKWKADPNLDKDHKKRIAQQELQKARAKVGANKKNVMVEITDREWDAIQAGAISTTMLKEILNNTDLDRVRQLATPRDEKGMTPGKEMRIRSYLASGNYTIAEIASAVGVSNSTVSRIKKEL